MISIVISSQNLNEKQIWRALKFPTLQKYYNDTVQTIYHNSASINTDAHEDFAT